MSRPHDPDVIVVGGGHNGLICAAYLARSGLDVVVVEARDDVGGCASTVSDLGARFNICNCDHTMIRAMPVIDELELATFGLRYLEPDLSGIHRFHDGSTPWVLRHDAEAHLESLAHTHPHAVDGYRRYLADAVPVAELVIAMASMPPSAASMARTALAHHASAAIRLQRWSRRSQADVLADYFDDEHLLVPAAVAGPTVWGVPHDAPGTGSAAALYAIRHVVRSGRPVGGSGALTDAIRASFEAAGGVTRCGARVERLLLDHGAVVGVRLTEGDELRGRAVVAACDPSMVLVDWLDTVPPAARRLVDRWRAREHEDGYESKVDAVVRGRPRWSGTGPLEAATGGADLLGPTTFVCPTATELAEAHELRAAGRVHAFPSLMVNMPSVLDPTMQPAPDEHVLSVEVLFTPYDLRGGWSSSDEPQRWLDVVAGHFEPGTLTIDRWRAMTPDRYESDFSMRRGHAPSYGGTPLAALLGRRRELTRYRTPIDGLYLSGAATFPGAGIFGASGRNAARAVEDDLRRPARRAVIRALHRVRAAQRV